MSDPEQIPTESKGGEAPEALEGQGGAEQAPASASEGTPPVPGKGQPQAIAAAAPPPWVLDPTTPTVRRGRNRRIILRRVPFSGVTGDDVRVCHANEHWKVNDVMNPGGSGMLRIGFDAEDTGPCQITATASWSRRATGSLTIQVRRGSTVEAKTFDDVVEDP